MESVDLEVLKTCMRWLQQERGVLLATVVRTWGSSPRPVGAMLAIREDGAVVGSVSGGCIEDDIVEQVRRNGIVEAKPYLLTYGISADEAHRFGLPCGGTIQLVMEPLSPTSGVDLLCSAVAEGRLVARLLDMASGQASLQAARATDGLQFDGKHLISVHGPRYRLLVIGAGQLSRYVCNIALSLDYQVTVCDPREEYVDEWNLPGVVLVRDMPDDTVDALKLDERCAVVAVTHDPKLDDLALMQALKTPAFYVGALGSRRNNFLRRERLREFDLSDIEIARLRGPVGIYIGSRTPPEIAVSIMAEVTAAKNGVYVPKIKLVEGAKESIASTSSEAMEDGCRSELRSVRSSNQT